RRSAPAGVGQHRARRPLARALASAGVDPAPRQSRALRSRLLATLHAMPLSAGQEGVDVVRELRVVLEEEAVRRVRVDLQTRLWDETGEQVGVAREDHGVAVA